MKFDAVIVGGGPAGSACAALLARAGHRVLLAERAPAPQEKICGEFVCPQAFEILERIGVRRRVEEEPHSEVRGMVLVSPDGRRVEAPFVEFQGRRGFRPAGVALRRSRFDGLLLENAAGCGAEVWMGARLAALHLEEEGAAPTFRMRGTKARLRVRAPLVIGADGRNSAVARFAGLSAMAPEPQRGVLHGYYESVAGMGEMGELHILRGGGYCALNPMPDGTCNVACVGDADLFRAWRGIGEMFLSHAFRSNPHLKRMFDASRPCARLRFLAPLRVTVRRPCRERVLLAGDAGGFYDPMTGEGIYSALRMAEMAAGVAGEALAAGDFSRKMMGRYARRRAVWMGPKTAVWSLLQVLIRREGFVNRLGAAMRDEPELAHVLVGISGNYLPPSILLRPGVFLRMMHGLLPRWPHAHGPAVPGS